MSWKLCLSSVTLCWMLAAISPCLVRGAGDAGKTTEDVTGVEQLEEQMLGDPGIMSLVLELQTDPQMQALLADPKIMDAVTAADVPYLLSDPRFRKLLDSKKVKDVGKKLEK